MKIYVASSWRNVIQPAIVPILRRVGHTVYDFRNPSPESKGFDWREIDPNWESWTTEQYREAMKHPIAIRGYGSDIHALRECEACLLVLPSGRSASWEFGYAMGQGKVAAVLSIEKSEAELMYREATILASIDELFDWAEKLDRFDAGKLGAK